MISLLEYVLCAFGIHALSDETEYRDGEPVQRCKNCELIFQKRAPDEFDALVNEHLRAAEKAFAARKR